MGAVFFLDSRCIISGRGAGNLKVQACETLLAVRQEIWQIHTVDLTAIGSYFRLNYYINSCDQYFTSYRLFKLPLAVKNNGILSLQLIEEHIKEITTGKRVKTMLKISTKSKEYP